MKFKRSAAGLALAVVAALCQACSVHQPSPDLIKPVAAERVLAPALTQARPGAGEIHLVRDAGLSGSIVSARISIDGKAVADLNTGEVLNVWVDPGVHRISMVPHPNYFGGGAARELDGELSSDGRLDLRVTYNDSGLAFVPEQAEAALLHAPAPAPVPAIATAPVPATSPAAVPAAAALQWHDIATAPGGSGKLLLYSPGLPPYIGRRAGDGWHEAAMASTADQPVSPQPTHWMPLPPAP